MRRSPARHAPQYPYYAPQPYYPPEPRGSSAGAIIGAVGTIVMTLAAVTVAAVFVWKMTGGVLPSLQGGTVTKPTVGIGTGNNGSSDAGATTGSDTTAYNATADAQQAAAIQAGAQAVVPPAAVAPAGVDTLGQPIPTAIILIPTAIPIEQVQVIPQSMPVLAAGSDMRPTPVTVMTYPTPLPVAVANDFEVSSDGTCITAPRNGRRYQVCQGWKYQPNELASVADYIRTGLLPGVEVQ